MAVLKRLQRTLATEPGPLVSLAAAIACVAVATLARWALAPLLGHTLWFPTYYPAVLISALALGWRLGVFSLLLSALVVDYLFIPPPLELSLEKMDIAGVAVFILSGGILVLTAGLLREAVRRLNAAAELQRALNRELQHRVNNNLAVVQALAAQTIRNNADPAQFYETFRERLIALSAAQRVLSGGDWQTCEFPDLPKAALEPFAASNSLSMDGPDCSVPSESCVPLVLALHELGTNAVKYGALSTPAGRVHLRWRLTPGEAGEELIIEWSESGGPPVRPPSRKGLGSRLLVTQSGLKAVRTEFPPEGARCTLLVAGARQARSANAKAAFPVVLAPWEQT